MLRSRSSVLRCRPYMTHLMPANPYQVTAC
jgi:hypothetical protein